MLAIARLMPYLRRLTAPAEPDGVLLQRFAGRRDQDAFAALVARHGPMVAGVCRRVLRDADAEDAFQAVFLVLARRAPSLSGLNSLAGWLHGVAQRVALKARASRWRVRPPQSLTQIAEPAAAADDPLVTLNARELVLILEEELARLPDPYRLAIVLCCLEGLSLEEAAHRLGCTTGSLRGKLERGRKRLHTRLTKRGVTLAAALAIVEAARQAGNAAVASLVVMRTVQAALAYTAKRATKAMLSTSSVALTEGVLRTMWLTKMRWIVSFSIALGGLTSVTGLMLGRHAVERPEHTGIGRPAQLARADFLPAARAQSGPSQTPVAASPWRKKLANGVTVELAGVSRHLVTPRSWWKPDGSPLAKPPFKTSPAPAPEPRHVFAIRLYDLPSEPIGYRCELSGAGAQGVSYSVDRDEARLELVSLFPAGQRTCTVHVGIAAGTWQTRARGNDAAVAGQKLSVIFGKLRPTRDGIAVAVSHTPLADEARLLLIDADGKAHRATSLSRSEGKSIVQLDAEFGVPSDRVRHIEFQTCPLDWAEFRNVQLLRRTDDARHKETEEQPGRPQKLARLPDPSPELRVELAAFDAYRHGSEERFAELERKAGRLLRRYPGRDDQARIHFAVAHVAVQSGIRYHVRRVRAHARKSLALNRDPLERGLLYSYLGSAAEVEAEKTFDTRRRQAAKELLAGYAEMLAQELPQKAPELPRVDKLGDEEADRDPVSAAQTRARHATQVEARRHAEFIAALVHRRDTLANQLRWLYHPNPVIHGRNPEGPTELRALAGKALNDPKAVDALLARVTAE
jgi:RNA polymerase sigma factor (sigma-70 family)